MICNAYGAVGSSDDWPAIGRWYTNGQNNVRGDGDQTFVRNAVRGQIRDFQGTPSIRQTESGI